MYKKILSLFTILFIILAIAAPVYAGQTAFGPEDLTIGNLYVHLSSHQFSVDDPSDGVLSIVKNTPDKEIWGGFCVLNGKYISLSDFLNGTGTIFEEDVDLRSNSRITTFLAGTPDASIKVEVKKKSVTPPPEVTFSADPTTIYVGQSSTLSWTSSNADTCAIEPGIGSINLDGSITVSPKETTTYTITAIGSGGTITANATVTFANSAPVANDQTVTLNEDETAPITLTASDADGDALTYQIVSNPSHGSLTGIAPNITYTPAENYNGGDAFTFRVNDGTIDSNDATVTITVNPVNDPPTVTFSASPATITQGGSSELSWTSENGQSAHIDNGIGTVNVNDSVTVNPEHTTTYTITVTGSGGSANAKTTVKVNGNPEPQPDGSYGQQYEDLVPPDSTVDEYDPKRFSLITGIVNAIDDSPIPDVLITIHSHPEYGTVSTDATGRFSMPVEGGGTITVVYQKEGFITSHRQVYVPWNDIAITETIQMIEQDPVSTTFTFDGNPATMVTHQSTEVTDEFGSRSTSIVFTGDNSAWLVDENGNDVQEMETITVRASEYATEDSMPAKLPPNSAYTYCVELAVDGAERVRFEEPVFIWVDNFIGFDVGMAVPVGYYDRDRDVWVPSDNGVVVKLLDTDSDSIIDSLDADGDDQPDDLNQDGSFSDEVAGLEDTAKYTPDSTFWRVAITHFTPIDPNWPSGTPPDATPPTPTRPPNPDQKKDPGEDPERHICSFVEEKSRIFHEDIKIPGTDMTLHYASNRVEGYKTVIDVPVSGDTIPTSLRRIIVRATLAGRTFEQVLEPQPNQAAKIEWDGLDYLGRQAKGLIAVNVSIGFVYPSFYMIPADFLRAFAQAGIALTPNQARGEFTAYRYYNANIKKSVNTVAEGWTLSSHHYMNPVDLSTLHKGNGTTINNNVRIIETVAGNGDTGFSGDGGPGSDAMFNNPASVAFDSAGNLFIADSYNLRIRKMDANGIITTVAGNGLSGFSGDGGPATDAMLHTPIGVTVDSGGNLFFNDTYNNRVRKVDTNGIITTVAGNGVEGFSGDGGPATDARILFAVDVAVDNAGNLFIADSGNRRIRKVDPSGIITTVAGNGGSGFSGDGGPATDAMFNNLRSIAVDNAGNLFIADSYNNRIRKVDSSGIITTVAGNGDSGFSGDGGPATDAMLYCPEGVTVDITGNLFIADYHNSCIRKVDTNGIITTVAGNGDFGFSGDGGPATLASVSNPYEVAVDSVGNLFIADIYNQRIRKEENFKTSLIGDILFAEKSDLGYIMSRAGLHKTTIDLDTGVTIREFGYDENNYLISITDQFGNQTTINRDGNGVPVSVVSPDGLTTSLTVDENNHLIGITYPDGSNYSFDYTSDGLIILKTEPEGNQFGHIFDQNGRITDFTDDEAGHWQFSRTVLDDGNILHETNTGEGNLTTYLDQTESTGAFTSTVTDPSGAQTIFAISDDNLTENTSLSCGMELEVQYDVDSEYKFKYVKEMHETAPSGIEKVVLREKTYEDTNTDDVPDLITETTDINGNETNLVNNVLQSGKTVTTPEGRTMTTQYDPATLLTESVKIPGLNATNYGYNPQGKLTSVSTGTRETLLSYNTQGFMDSFTDPEGYTTTYTHDAVGRITGVGRPDGSSLGFTYDGNGNMTVLTNPTSIQHGFGFNAVNLNSSYQAPISGTYSYVYDRDRRLTEINFPSGRQISNIYDTIRLSQVRTPEGNIDYTYVCGSNVGSITKGTEAIAYGYDGSLVTSVDLTGTLNKSLGYTYNNDFNFESFTYSGDTEDYTYDNDGLLSGAGSFTITRNAQNGLPEALSGGTLSQSRTFNGYGEQDGQISTISAQSVGSWSLAQDDNGQITQKIETVDGITSTYDYTYDPMGRLLTVTKDGAGSPIEEYDYDINGTRIYEMNSLRGIAGRTFTYSDEDHLLTAVTTTYQYDVDGFLTTKTDGTNVTTYNYSSRGELIVVSLPDSSIIEYLHDPLGRRIAKIVDGITVEKYLWQGLTRLLGVYDGSNNLIMRFEYADNRVPVAMTRGGVTYYLTYDQVGSLRVVADSAGNVVKRIDYDSFGNIIADTDPLFNMPFGFAGGLHDRDTDLVRFGYRDYDPDIGRWTAKDPILFSGGDTDLYGYVLNDPVNAVDPLGLGAACELSCILKGVGRIVGVSHLISGVDALIGGLLSKVRMPAIVNLSATGAVAGVSGASQFLGAEKMAHSLSDPIIECIEKCRNEDDGPCNP